MYPVPEAISGDKWSVAEGIPRTDMRSREMWVPAADTPEAAFLRAHETAHARITPKVHANAACKKFAVSMEALQCVEDMRVHQFLEARDIDRCGALGPEEVVQRMMEIWKDNPRRLAGALVGSYRTGDFDHVYAAIDRLPIGREVIRGWTTIRDFYDEMDDTLRQKKRVYRGKYRPYSHVRGFRDLTVPTARLFDAIFPEAGITGDADAEKLAKYARRYGARPRVQWGKLAPVERAKLSKHRRPKQSGGKAWRDEGAVPAAIYRMTLDGRIFNRKRRLRGGTVLVDASGSMGLTDRDLERIVEAAPGATVAAYCGDDRHGKLVIVAERGRMATGTEIDNRCDLGGNVVDGPALRWLAKQAGPRVWVSDGMVTGVGDACCLELMREALVICQQADIKRVEKAEFAADELARG